MDYIFSFYFLVEKANEQKSPPNRRLRSRQCDEFIVPNETTQEQPQDNQNNDSTKRLTQSPLEAVHAKNELDLETQDTIMNISSSLKQLMIRNREKFNRSLQAERATSVKDITDLENKMAKTCNQKLNRSLESQKKATEKIIVDVEEKMAKTYKRKLNRLLLNAERAASSCSEKFGRS